MISKIVITALVLGTLVSVCGVATTEVYAEQCEDIKGEEKWDGVGDGDNNPSRNKFDEMIFEDDKTTCEVAEAIDHMEIEGEIKHHEWDEFKDTFTYQGTSEEVQECFEDRFDLPDSGKKHLAGYEIKDCATGNY
mgnify:FL=1